MTKKIRSVRDLPKWFDLSKYDALKSLDSKGWYWQVSARHSLLFYAIEQADCRDESFEGLLSELRRNPVLDIEDHRNSRYLNEVLIPPQALSVASLTQVRDFLTFIPAQHKKAAWQYLQGEMQLSKLPVALAKHQVSDKQTLLAVDFSLPAQVLVDSFRAIVQSAQSEGRWSIDSRERFRAPNFAEWMRIGIIPYLDLWAWAIENDVSIPNRVYADAIFSGDEEGEETVRKTTYKLALDIFQGTTLTILGALQNQDI